MSDWGRGIVHRHAHCAQTDIYRVDRYTYSTKSTHNKKYRVRSYVVRIYLRLSPINGQFGCLFERMSGSGGMCYCSLRTLTFPLLCDYNICFFRNILVNLIAWSIDGEHFLPCRTAQDLVMEIDHCLSELVFLMATRAYACACLVCFLVVIQSWPRLPSP